MTAAATTSEHGRGLRSGSLRRRVTLAVLALLAVMLVVLALTVDVILGSRMNGQIRERLTDRVATAEALAGTVSDDEIIRRIGGSDVGIRLVSSDGTVRTSGSIPPDAADPVATSGSGPSDTTPSRPAPGGKPAPARPPVPKGTVVQDGSMLFVDSDLANGSHLTVFADSRDVERTLTQLRVVLVITSVVVLALAAGALWLVVGRALAPLDEMTAVARSITLGDRGSRLRPDRPRTELGRTASAFDEMLDELEGAESTARAAEGRMRDFVSDAAHELRTPVAGLQASAESLLRGDPSPEQRERLEVSVVREARRAGRLVDNLLTMARLQDGLVVHPVRLDLLQAASAAVDRSLGHGSSVPVAGPSVLVDADADQLAQVLANLLTNATRAAGPDGAVEVRTSTVTGTAYLDVTDTGPGVPDGDRERIFERLVRLDEARDRDRGGFGLGLPIARAIARAHGGDLVCMPSSDGAHFRLSLPAPDLTPG